MCACNAFGSRCEVGRLLVEAIHAASRAYSLRACLPGVNIEELTQLHTRLLEAHQRYAAHVQG